MQVLQYLQVLEEADIIFVYDYCHYIHWLGYAHGLREDEFDIQEGPGDILLALYSEMMKMPVWKKFNGGQFALYDPHPGFFQGESWPGRIGSLHYWASKNLMPSDIP